MRDEEEKQQKDPAAAEEAVGQVSLRYVPADADRSNTAEENSFLGKGRTGE